MGFDLEDFFVCSIVFFGTMSIIGIYSGYLGLISSPVAIVAILVSLLLASKFVSSKNIDCEEKFNQNIVIVLSVLYVFFLLYQTLPYLVFPHSAGDFQNHAMSTRTIADSHSFGGGLARYPAMYYGVSGLFYTLYSHSYTVSTLLAIAFTVLSFVGLYFIAKDLFDSEIALFSVIIAMLNITNIFVLEQGFFPYLMGQFFFIASIYSYLAKDKNLLILSNVGLMSYPHLFIVYFLFVCLEVLRTSKLKSFASLGIASLITFPETYGLFWGLFRVNLPRFTIPFRGTLLIRGGILTPTFVSLLIFVPAIYGLCLAMDERKFANFILSIGLLMSAILVAFYYVFVAGYTDDLHLLYMVPKLYYLLVFPLSIVAGIGVVRFCAGRVDGLPKKMFLVCLFFAFFSFHFITYIGTIVPQKAAFPGEIYEIAAEMNTWPGEFKVGINPALGNNVGWKPQHPYKSIIDLPDGGYTLDTTGLNRMFHFSWAKRVATSEGPIVVNHEGEAVIKYSPEEVDYYITHKRLNMPVAFKEGGVYVYAVS